MSSSRRPSVRPSVIRRRPPFSKISSTETTWPNKAKFYVEPALEGETKVYIKGTGHMTKMAAMPIYGKKPSKIFSGTGGPISTKLGMYNRGHLPIIGCTNDYPGVTLPYFTPRSKFEKLRLFYRKNENNRFFRKHCTL